MSRYIYLIEIKRNRTWEYYGFRKSKSEALKRLRVLRAQYQDLLWRVVKYIRVEVVEILK